MRRRRGTLTEADREAWATFAHRIRPLDGKPPVAAPPTPPVPDPAPAKPIAPPPPPARRPHPPLAVDSAPAGLDASTWNRFRGGRLAPVRTLDLHGRTANRALHALTDFLEQAHADQVRAVEVITGRGSGETGGVLRRELPIWLNGPRLRPLILAVAHPHAGNLGAMRVLIRRRRLKAGSD